MLSFSCPLSTSHQDHHPSNTKHCGRAIFSRHRRYHSCVALTLVPDMLQFPSLATLPSPANSLNGVSQESDYNVFSFLCIR